MGTCLYFYLTDCNYSSDFVPTTKIEQLLLWKLQSEAPNKSRLFGFSVCNQISIALEWRRCVTYESYLHCECVSQLYQVYCRPLATQHPSPLSVRNAKVYFEPAAISVRRSAPCYCFPGLLLMALQNEAAALLKRVHCI
jgi:hypothetical protein